MTIAPLDWQNIVLRNNGNNNASSSSSEEQYTNPTFAPGPSSSEPHSTIKSDLNDLVRDMGSSKQQSEILGCHLKE